MVNRVISAIAAEHFVATVALKDHLRAWCNGTRHHPEWNVRRIEEWCAVVCDQFLDAALQVFAPDDELMVFGSEVFGKSSCQWPLIGEGWIIKACGKRLDAAACRLDRKRGDGARVNAAGKEDADRDVADELPLDGFEQLGAHRGC